MLARRVTFGVVLALICGVGLAWWRVASGDPRGELVTDADQVTGTWELIRLEDMRRDRVYYDVGITVTPYADTWEFMADAGCSTTYRGYLDIADSGQVTVDVLGAVGAQVGCHGQLKAVPNVDALYATETIRLAGDNTLSLIDVADNVLGTYHLVGGSPEG